MLYVILIKLLLSDSQTTEQDSDRLSETLEACKMDSFSTIPGKSRKCQEKYFSSFKTRKLLREKSKCNLNENY